METPTFCEAGAEPDTEEKLSVVGVTFNVGSELMVNVTGSTSEPVELLAAAPIDCDRTMVNAGSEATRGIHANLEGRVTSADLPSGLADAKPSDTARDTAGHDRVADAGRRAILHRDRLRGGHGPALCHAKR